MIIKLSLALISIFYGFLGHIPHSLSYEAYPLGNPHPVPGKPFNLSIENAIDIGLKNNLTLLNAQARRTLQKFDLRLAERRFVPIFTLDSELNTARNSGSSTNTDKLSIASIGPRVSVMSPTGARVTARMNGQLRKGTTVTGTKTWGASIEFDQPLLRGNGLHLNELPILIAQKTDDISRQTLKSLYNQMAVTIIQSYYDAILAERQRDIAKRSLERSIQLVENNKVLIKAGRLAQTELEQAKADVAVQNRALLDVNRQYDEATRRLLLLLNIAPETKVNFVTLLQEEDYNIPSAVQTIAISRQSNPGYSIAHLGIDIAHENITLATNNLLPDLSLVGGYNFNDVSGFKDSISDFDTHQSQSDWRVGLRLSFPLNDLNRKRRTLSAKVTEGIARNDLILFDQKVQSEIQRGIANLKSLKYQMSISRRGVEYSKRAVDAENEKFQAGRSSNFQVLLLENSLNAAQQNKIRDTVEFLKAVVQIELLKGTILDGWEVANAS